MQDNHPTIYTTPDGYHLRYAFPWESKGDQFSRFRRTSVRSHLFTKQLNSPEKRLLPQLDLDSSYNYPIICADFDELDSRFNSFDEMADYMTRTYGDLGCVLRSPSNKVKVLFQFTTGGKSLTKLDRVASLESILSPDDFKLIDTQPYALSKIFLNQAMFEQIRVWKPQHVLQGLFVADYKHKRSLEDLKVEYTHGNLKDSIESFSEDEMILHAKLIAFMRSNFLKMERERVELWAGYLVRYRKQLTFGMALNQGLCAQMLDCPISHVNKILNILNSLGLLVKVSDSYCAGMKAQKRKAGGRLRELLVSLNKHNPTNLDDIEIDDSNANAEYLKLTRILFNQGYTREDAIEKLVEADSYRPPDKQRSASYFTYMVSSWYNRQGVA